MSGEEDNIFICARCSCKFRFCPDPAEGEEVVRLQVRCPQCGTGYVRKVFTFPKGYARKPHN